jgi:hypothetical protein
MFCVVLVLSQGLEMGTELGRHHLLTSREPVFFKEVIIIALRHGSFILNNDIQGVAEICVGF